MSIERLGDLADDLHTWVDGLQQSSRDLAHAEGLGDDKAITEHRVRRAVFAERVHIGIDTLLHMATCEVQRA